MRRSLALFIALLVMIGFAEKPVWADPPLPLPRMPICGDQDGSETPLTFRCANFTPSTDVQIFQVPGTGQVELRFDFVFREATFNNELGFYKVENAAGTVNGIGPGAPGYLAAALANATIVFPSGSTASTPDVILNLNGGELLAFFIVQGNSLANFLANNPSNELSKVPLAFFALNRLNPDSQLDHFIGYRNTSTNYTQFGFEDITNGGDRDYDDIVYNITPPLEPLTGQVNLIPAQGSAAIYSVHSLTAAVTDINGAPMAGVPVTFAVSGVNNATFPFTTDAAGAAILSYVSTSIGTDSVVATASVGGREITSNRALVQWFDPSGGPCDAVTEIPATECEALVALYNSTGGANWINSTGWLTTNTPCSWYGVLCASGHVSELSLSFNQLNGSIPPELGNLGSLGKLTLGVNQLNGSIPLELSNLSGLWYLDLSYNQLSGHVPAWLGNLSNLWAIVLHDNQFSGNLPSELGQLAGLYGLYLDHTQLAGALPTSLTNLSLTNFWFNDTNLCEPQDAAFQAWLASIPNLGRSGIKCSDVKTWTLMFYLAGDNDLDEATTEWAVQRYLEHLKTFTGMPDVNIAVLYDGKAWGDSSYIAIGDNITYVSKSELNTGDPATLIDFVAWARNTFPSKHTALTIFDHGHGLVGVARDDSATSLLGCHPFVLYDCLKMKDLSSAASQIVAHGGKIDLVFMQTCVMASIEAAYQIKDLAEYYVSSEQTAWYEPLWFPTFITASTTPQSLALGIASEYHAILSFAVSPPRPHTISVAWLPRIPELTTKLSMLAKLLKGNITDIRTVMSQVQRFDSNDDGKIDLKDELIDLYDFARLMKSTTSNQEVASAATAVMDIIYDNPENRYIIEHLSQSSSDWHLDQSYGVMIFATAIKRSFYDGDNLDFAAGTIWGPSSSSVGATPVDSATEMIEWGPMLVDYVNQTDPDAPDDPVPPELQSFFFPGQNVYLPQILRQ